MSSFRSFALLSFLAPALFAGIVSTTGDATITPAASATYVANGFNDNCTVCPIHVWVEQTNIALSSAVVLDTDFPTTAFYGNGSPMGEVLITSGGGATLAKGKRINSYYAYQDPINSHRSQGTVTFAANEMVLGVLVFEQTLANTDFLRVAAAPYPGVPAFNDRGLELGPERLQLSADRRTLYIDMTASSPGDQIRIITMTADVPEPGTAALLAGALLGLGVLVRRRR